LSEHFQKVFEPGHIQGSHISISYMYTEQGRLMPQDILDRLDQDKSCSFSWHLLSLDFAPQSGLNDLLMKTTSSIPLMMENDNNIFSVA